MVISLISVLIPDDAPCVGLMAGAGVRVPCGEGVATPTTSLSGSER